MMNTTYGDIELVKVKGYLDSLKNRVFKILPLHEEGCKTLDSYIESLSREIVGNSKIFLKEEMLIISGTLNGLDFNNYKALRSDIFKAITLIEKMKGSVC